MRIQHTRASAGAPSDADYSPAMHREMIAVAAYYRAEHRGFRGGEELSDWLEAEAEIGQRLKPRPRSAPNTSAKQAFQQKLEARIKEWDVKLAQLKAKAQAAKAEIRTEFEVELEALESKRAIAEEKLQELRQHGEWAWEDLKDGADKAWSELREAIERSASQFK